MASEAKLFKRVNYVVHSLEQTSAVRFPPDEDEDGEEIWVTPVKKLCFPRME